MDSGINDSPLLDKKDYESIWDDIEHNKSSKENSQRVELDYIKTNFDVDFENTKELEEETEVTRVMMLQISYFKWIFVVPLLWLLTVFLILLFMFWSVNLTKWLLYWKWSDISRATHLLVYGTRKQKEIVKLKKGTKK